jgi:hypothetical protein
MTPPQSDFPPRIREDRAAPGLLLSELAANGESH